MIALASLGLSGYSSMPYGVFEFACSDLCHSFRSEFLLLEIRLAALFISRCWAAFCALSFAVLFSVVGSLCFSVLEVACFCWGRFCIARAGASPSGTR